MKTKSLIIALFGWLCVCGWTHAAPQRAQEKPVTSKQKIEALLNEQARLYQLLEIQQRQLQDMSNRFNATRVAEPSAKVPYTYP